ncbi:XRE family transcriptional regulator [Micromonospora sp. 15K316]|uniref:helix-turn-helix domain-containing protein n=1 Tax=Micromonospora sp. 15K316 TaxID=2530376 RepID=UPI001046448C|nr:helix-turn-helix domain-containing protein [Micromonospora sp. 15K316]TDC30352.1 XRE family transcriptional regulator [Micromonospora sp. 15K316]
MTESDMVLGDLLQTYRNSAGLTQQKLADLSTVSIRTIRDLELGKVRRPRRETVQLLANAMGLRGSRRTTWEMTAGRASATETIERLLTAQPGQPWAPMGPTVGRDSELELLLHHLRSGRDRLVKLVGLAGVGKTRLALAACRAINEEDGVIVAWLPDGEAGPPGGRVRLALAAQIGKLLDRDVPAVDDLASAIGTQHVLLVVDGQETTRIPTITLRAMLDNCPALRILCTSREPYPDPTALVMPLAPLPLPEHSARSTPAEVTSQPAISLWLSNVQRLRPDFGLTESSIGMVVDICRTLDGIPSALEAAAAWSLVYSLDEIHSIAREDPLVLAQMPNHPPGGTDLGILLMNTISELKPEQASLLHHVATLHDPWPLEQASQVANRALGEVARSVHSLVLRGLVRRQEPTARGLAQFGILNLARALIRPSAPGGWRAGPMGSGRVCPT